MRAREIRTPVSEGQWISSPPQYQAMRSPPSLVGEQSFQESILVYSSWREAIIARPSPTIATPAVKPGTVFSLLLGLLCELATFTTSSTK